MTLYRQEAHAKLDEEILRSEVYVRDKATCWVCHNFVLLRDYDLGHLVDKCNGGQTDLENVVVMHHRCNVAKPRHTTLDEATRWRNVQGTVLAQTTAITNPRPKEQLTFMLPDMTQLASPLIHSGKIAQSPVKPIEPAVWNITTPQRTHARRPIHPSNLTIKPETVKKRQVQYEESMQRIKPCTLVWVQGRPWDGPMWRVLPPPYREEDRFTMRMTPPGATDNGGSNIYTTLQVIGGGELTSDLDIPQGYLTIHINASDRSKPQATVVHNLKSNNGRRMECVGMGQGQIPISLWQRAKAYGWKLASFRVSYQEYIRNHPTLHPAEIEAWLSMPPAN